MQLSLVTLPALRSEPVRASESADDATPQARLFCLPEDPVVGQNIRCSGELSHDPDGTIEDYYWVIESGPATVTRDVEWSYMEPGTYTIELTVEDNESNTDTITRSITVSEPTERPVARIACNPTNVTVGESVSCRDDDTRDPENNIVDRRWSFGDGSVAHGTNVSHSYTSQGNYTITYRVEDRHGHVDRAKTDVRVGRGNRPPEARINWTPQIPAVGYPVSFRANGSTDPDGRITGTIWKFSNDSVKYGPSVDRTFDTAGDHTVRIVLRDDAGEQTVTTRTITVVKQPRTGFQFEPAMPLVGQQVVLRAGQSTNTSRYEWDLDNDGTFEQSGETVSYAFDSAGSHVVVLRETSVYGTENLSSQVIPTRPSPSFDIQVQTSDLTLREMPVPVRLTVSNPFRNQTLHAKLILEPPSNGIALSGTRGTNLTHPRATEYVTVSPGETRSLRVYLRVSEAGRYNVSSRFEYYVGEQSDLQERSVGPVQLQVTRPTSTAVSTTSEHGIGFDAIITILALLVGLGVQMLRDQ